MEGNPNYSGTWEVSNGAIVNSSEVILVQRGSKAVGTVYFDGRLPENAWNIAVNASFPVRHTEKRFGVWFTKDFAPYGHAFGGPVVFTGAAILVQSNGTHVKVEIREDDGQGNYYPTSFFPIFVHEFKTPNFVVKAVFSENVLNVSMVLDGTEHKIFQNRVRISIKRSYFGITGFSQLDLTPIYLHSVLIGGHKDIEVVNKSTVNLIENGTKPLRNRRKEKSEDKNVFDILLEVDSLRVIASELARSDKIISALGQEILPFSDSWQRRSLNIVDSSKALAEMLVQGVNVSSSYFSQFQQSVVSNVHSLRRDVGEIESALYFGILGGYSLDHRLKQVKKGVKAPSTPLYLRRLAIVEIFVLIFYLVVSEIKRRMQG